MKKIIALTTITLCSCASYQVEKPTNIADTVETKYGIFYIDSLGVILDIDYYENI